MCPKVLILFEINYLQKMEIVFIAVAAVSDETKFYYYDVVFFAREYNKITLSSENGGCVYHRTGSSLVNQDFKFVVVAD